jgi:hypothetical protein
MKKFAGCYERSTCHQTAPQNTEDHSDYITYFILECLLTYKYRQMLAMGPMEERGDQLNTQGPFGCGAEDYEVG